MSYDKIKENSFCVYGGHEEVKHLLFVWCEAMTSNAVIQLYEKTNFAQPEWKLVLECKGYIGKNGATENKREGDNSTPLGDFGVVTAFGIEPNPGTVLNWIDVTNDLWVPDQPGEGYNTIVSTKNGGRAVGEHLIDYSPQYNYAMFLNYNPECNPQKGSAIFFHCTGSLPYTGGCVAVSEADMIYILTQFRAEDRVIISPM